jgi:hypothetical protein
LRTNLFVRVQSYGFDINSCVAAYPSSSIKVLTTQGGHYTSKAHKKKRFPWYVMDLIFERRNGTDTTQRPLFREIVMLWVDLGDFCSRLQIDKTTRLLQSWSTDVLKTHIKLNTKLASKVGRLSLKIDCSDLQSRLVLPLQHNLRDLHNLTVEGCLDEQLVQEVTQDVAQLLWTNAETFLAELQEHEQAAARAWRDEDYLSCADSCAIGINIIDRLSIPWSGAATHLQQTNQAAKNAIEHHYFYFNMCRARCLYVYLDAPEAERTDIDYRKHIGSTCYKLVQSLKAIEHVMCDLDEPLAVYVPPSTYAVLKGIEYPTEDVAEYHYLYAYCLRLYLDCGDDNLDTQIEAREHIEKCVELHPRSLKYITEKEKISELIG